MSGQTENHHNSVVVAAIITSVGVVLAALIAVGGNFAISAHSNSQEPSYKATGTKSSPWEKLDDLSTKVSLLAEAQKASKEPPKAVSTYADEASQGNHSEGSKDVPKTKSLPTKSISDSTVALPTTPSFPPLIQVTHVTPLNRPHAGCLDIGVKTQNTNTGDVVRVVFWHEDMTPHNLANKTNYWEAKIDPSYNSHSLHIPGDFLAVKDSKCRKLVVQANLMSQDRKQLVASQTTKVRF